MPKNAGNLALKAPDAVLGDDEALDSGEFSQHLHQALRRLSASSEVHEVIKFPRR